ncbi:MAG: cytochrome c [Dehalococcoidia bacterium]|nr:MAG: cytochrome c [Dehalococcoidia bacterium]
MGAPFSGRPTPTTTPVAADTLDGKVLYQAHCASCHGTRGEGQADWKNKKPDGTNPAPPHDPSGHTWHHADGLLFRIVRDGGQAAGGGAGFKSAMPAARDTLSDAQIRATLEYIKTFWGPAERKSQASISAGDPYP